jgi:hypothetical protein
MVANFGKTVATVYDATYGFQINILRKSLSCINWLLSQIVSGQYFKQFPDSNIVKVSINLLKESKKRSVFVFFSVLLINEVAFLG